MQQLYIYLNTNIKKGNLVRFAHLCPVKSFLNVFPFIKGTVSVMSSNPTCKDEIARFTTVSLKVP